jgi:hypothetical protein
VAHAAVPGSIAGRADDALHVGGRRRSREEHPLDPLEGTKDRRIGDVEPNDLDPIQVGERGTPAGIRISAMRP